MNHYKLYALKCVSGGRGNRILPLHKLGEEASVRNTCDPRSVRTRSSGFNLKYWWLYKYSPASPSSFTQPVSNLNPSLTPTPYLSPKCHPSQVLPRCIGALPAWAPSQCIARRGEPTFSNDYQSAATHYSHSIYCNKSTRGIKAVTVQLITRPQHRSRWSAWRLAPPLATRPIPPHRCHDIGCNITKSTISYGYDILRY